ncbi:MAG: aldehyde dehydrogenase family protein, partial [Bacteroidales bacterium]|nr:aldehyde dehydrogenase family protein [Bacteroidales bacterium]
LVEESVYNDKQFQEKLIDCATSYKVGSVWNKGNIVGPMITNNNEKLLKAISTLEPGESWLVAPRWVDEKHYILAPTVKWGVRPGSYSFRTELFAPMLSVCPMKDLKEAVDLVNTLDYGLTSGVQSLDEKEQRYWRDNIEAGNLYINRGITGAIVNRQPFGGMKLSAFGGGIKAGGPNYVAQFMKVADKPGAVKDWEKSYAEAYAKKFSTPRDWNHCIGEQNLFRYLPVKSMALRLFEGDSAEDVKKVVKAAQIIGAKLTISIDAANALAVDGFGVPVVRESLADFIKNIKQYERIRTIADNVPAELWQAAADNDRYIAALKPMNEGRLELINYIKEQSIAYEYHRYGSMPVVPEDK